eukprot:CAMPEP_0198368794 /NCGR_PEP_ID=MMETSP1450-20131203/155879_1 /TAXON_ID=753684 ORGANISM="Madagascaria erythrocladiodes, Strain CCMP3234" /NCGR_SAMPLE_ID=MMETSP1450 /ASSEMBLY_ACC=CAM_ASM_001115 /LENGTH=364 /DNA_ID=CAMNT_0044076307 /DNA_START=2107 /DNA_END=3201 /DNA_ORIENTATION=+
MSSAAPPPADDGHSSDSSASSGDAAGREPAPPAGSDEMMYIRKGVLDTVVVQQQKRIAELERKLSRSKQEVLRLRALAAAATATATAAPDTMAAVTKAGATPLTATLDDKAAAGDKATAARTVVDDSRNRGADPAMSAVSTESGGARARKGKEVVIEGQTRYWTADEHARFLKGVGKFGPRNYAAIATLVRSRTAKQVRTHAQKYEMRLAREAIRKSPQADASGGLSQHQIKAQLQPLPSPPAPQPEPLQIDTKLEPKRNVTPPNSSCGDDEPSGKGEPETAEQPVAMEEQVPTGVEEFAAAAMEVMEEGAPLDEPALLAPEVAAVVEEAQQTEGDGNVLMTFGRSFSKSDLKAMVNEDAWLDI